jgi:hypothetical protein
VCSVSSDKAVTAPSPTFWISRFTNTGIGGISINQMPFHRSFKYGKYFKKCLNVRLVLFSDVLVLLFTLLFFLFGNVVWCVFPLKKTIAYRVVVTNSGSLGFSSQFFWLVLSSPIVHHFLVSFVFVLFEGGGECLTKTSKHFIGFVTWNWGLRLWTHSVY